VSSVAICHVTGRERSKRLGLVAICLGFLMITLDATIVNVALGPIVADVGGSLGTAQWIVNGYTLAFAALLLSAGALGDRLGARAGFLVGLALFAAGSGACAASTSLGLLIAARVVQGAGAAWLMPNSLALITHGYPDAAERRHALAFWGAASGIGLASGPVLGGLLTAAIGWRAIFLVNVPIALAAGALLASNVAETRRHPHALDRSGQLLGVAALTLLVAWCIVAGQRGWGSVAAVALLVAGTIAAATFVAVERAVEHPMVDPELFTHRAFAAAIGIGVVFNFGLYGAIFCLATGLREGHGLSALDDGLALLPLTLVTGSMAYLSERLVTRLGEWRVIAGGLGAGALGALLIALNRADGPLAALIVASVPLGFTALAMPAMTAVAVGHAPAHRVGLASGVFNASRQTGGAFGVALLGSLLVVGGGVSLHIAFAAAAIAYAVGALVALGHHLSERTTP
jgi:DHA2 family methylenomycin A resistance protein-like MFS transporter